jgi:hypothetical protein
MQTAHLQTDASIASSALGIAATVAATMLCVACYHCAVRPSTLISIYLSSLLLNLIARARTIWLVAGHGPTAVMITAQAGFTAVVLGLESIVGSDNVFGIEKNQRTIEERSSFWIRTSFAWLAATFRLGYSKVISASDLPGLDAKLESHALHQSLASTWERCA